MNRHPAFILLLSLTLLFSMTEIYKVTMLGFTVLTDVEKASRFCTCTGCSHSHDDSSVNEHDQNKMQEMDHTGHKEKPSHCSMNSSDTGKPSVCSCSTSPDKEIPILYNSLDKAALLTPVRTNHPLEKESRFLILQKNNTISLSKDIFHPPKRA